MSSVLLHNKLKAIRICRGISQNDLAELVGCSRNTISNLENGLFTPTMLLASKISIALDFPVDQIFSLDVDIIVAILDRRVKLGVVYS